MRGGSIARSRLRDVFTETETIEDGIEDGIGIDDGMIVGIEAMGVDVGPVSVRIVVAEDEGVVDTEERVCVVNYR